MNPPKTNHPSSATSRPQRPKQATSDVKKESSMDLKSLLSKLKKLEKHLAKHFSFIVIIAALLVYLLVVYNIRSLITASPSIEAEEEALISTKVPRIDQKGISQIQKLEQSNAKIRSLFDDARNNPFHE